MTNQFRQIELSGFATFFVGLILVSCQDEEIIMKISNNEGYPLKKESYFNLKDSSIYKTIEYSYNSEKQLISKIENHYVDMLESKKSAYFYNDHGNLVLVITKQTGWIDGLTPIIIERKTKYTYSNDILESEITYVDSAGRGFEQKKYYYTNKKLDSIEYHSYAVQQNLRQKDTEYYRYKGNLLVEKGYDKTNDAGLNTTYKYSKGLLIKAYNKYSLTSYEYRGILLKKQITASENMIHEKIEFFYAGNVLKEKSISHFTYYSENPYEPYFIETVLFEY